jgi:DNA-binding transcriptional LysR family regulator
MELRDLQIFQSVARHESISNAAKELSYVQSNVTARIKQLENELKRGDIKSRRSKNDVLR